MQRVLGFPPLSVVAAVCCLAGCSANASLTGARSPGARPQRCFWPPPPSTSLWVMPAGSSSGGQTMAEVGNALADALRRRGYAEQRWFPIGLAFAHGFAVTTRLEHVATEATTAERGRWVSSYAEPANLFWLSGARSVPLPRAGKFRVFLVAFTDLPLALTTTAPVWTEDTVMAGPEIPEPLTAEDVPAGRHLKAGHLGVYSYVYGRALGDDHGQFVAPHALRTPEEPPVWLTTRR